MDLLRKKTMTVNPTYEHARQSNLRGLTNYDDSWYIQNTVNWSCRRFINRAQEGILVVQFKTQSLMRKGNNDNASTLKEFGISCVRLRPITERKSRKILTLRICMLVMRSYKKRKLRIKWFFIQNLKTFLPNYRLFHPLPP